MPQIADSIDSYTAAWNAAGHEECVRLLTESWVGDGEFLNVQQDSPLIGVEQLARCIDETNAQFAGHRTVLAGNIVEHDSCALVPWRYVGADGLATLEGMNFVEFDWSGLIRPVVQFFPVSLPL